MDIKYNKKEYKSDLDVEKLLNALENETNVSVFNYSTRTLKEMNFKILKELPLPSNEILELLKKLKGYKYVDELDDLRHGSFLRWIQISDGVEKFDLKKGGVLCDIRITNKGIQIVCKVYSYKPCHISFMMDECMIFQKLTDQENIILTALDSLEK